MKVARVMIDENVFYPSNLFTKSELMRLRFKYSGMISEFTESRRKMVLTTFFIFRTFFNEVLCNPYKYLKSYPIGAKTRIKLRVVGSILFHCFFR